MMPATGLPSWRSSAARHGTSVNSHDPAERLLGRHPRFLLGTEHLNRLEMLEHRAIQSFVKKKRLPFTSPKNFLNRLTVASASPPPVIAANRRASFHGDLDIIQ